jgi:putative PIN family toxin of toxin-antitoxin system
MPSVVVDTTVLISGFITPDGVSAKLLEQAPAGAFRLCLSREIIEELRSRLLRRRRIRKSYQYADERVHQHCRDLEAACRLITDLPQVRLVEGDPNDDMVSACALQAHADSIVTRDKDLLSLTCTRASGSSRRASLSIFSKVRAPVSEHQMR